MFVDGRRRFVDWLRRQLAGPVGGEGEVLRMSPLKRYPTGVLHPADPVSGIDALSSDPANVENALLDEEDEDEGDDPENDRSAVQPARRRRYVPPSSVGFSFCVRGAVSLRITASAAVYSQEGDRDAQGRFLSQEFRREPLQASVTWAESDPPADPIWDGHAGIDVRTRKHQDGTILTVTLFNQQQLDPQVHGRTADRTGKALFQVDLRCAVASGDIVEYPRVNPSLLTEEEQELELQYKERRIYAVGHGAAAGWRIEAQAPPEIWADFMPTVETPAMTVESGHDALLTLDRLATEPRPEELSGFVEGYAVWVAEQRLAAGCLQGEADQAAASRVLDKMDTALGRMRACVAMLRTDAVALEAFRLANRAMRDQMRQGDVGDSERDGEEPRWRPFQLAFLLTVMESAIREDDGFRDVLDLIWFPTGGGKTEAYLGLIAFLILWRRLKYGRVGAGTVAFMRYTLRLLTRQQFERAARMICALELIRREDARLGEEAITVGIWVGQKSTPNTFAQAKKAVEMIADGGSMGRYALLLERCPWCANPFDAHDTSYDAADTSFHFYCCNSECAFGVGDKPLPCNVVDEALYENPPALLIATIDKFACTAWEERAGAFFGTAGVRPPELIVQDELHLITGPLGSVAGIYEAGFDTLLAERGVRPKYVASTATIRMAEQQVRALYARDLAVFPPPGLSCDDTFFARVDRRQPGRLYMGYLAPLLDQQHCLAPLAGALLLGPEAVFRGEVDKYPLLDAWWTQVLYHGSLKGVGNSENAFATDIRDFARMVAEQRESTSEGDESGSADVDLDRHRGQVPDTAQLTSRRTAEENAETFRRLEARRGDADCLDAVLATNMISVGLDVGRLALMIVNGQPLTTAEYIQASSRVGRNEVPGLVVANYYRHQARSLSHYENFRAYHESFYRFVEPSSVTPFTYQVRTRALHAALVIAMRHACEHLRANKSAGDFHRDNRAVRQVLSGLKARLRRATPTDYDAVAKHVDQLTDQWHNEAQRCVENRVQLKYQEGDGIANAERLLYGHNDTTRGIWPTLHSMRNVESEGRLRLDD